MDIYVFTRADGLKWADFRLPDGAKAHRQIHAETAEDIRKVIARETGRVRALAVRALCECEPPQDPVKIVDERTFWGRMKWLFSGR